MLDGQQFLRMRIDSVDRDAEDQLMRRARIVGLLVLLLIASCAVERPGAPVAPAPTAVPHPAAGAETTPGSPATPRSPTAQKAAPAPSAKAPASPTPSVQAPKAAGAAPAAAKPKVPTLDLASLEQRLRDTTAIGVLTKITIKNQVDDLLDQFRSYYQGKLKTTLAELRRPYDLLVLKVLALLQDSDPALASAVVASREAIWGILSDPKKFATI